MKPTSMPWFVLVAALLAAAAVPPAHNAAAQASGVAIAVILPAAAKTKDISLAQLRRIFRGVTSDFNGNRMVPFNYSIENLVRRAFDHVALELGPEQIGTYWIDRRIRGQGMPPRSVASPYIMKALVAKMPGAIGYVTADQLDATVLALTIDGKSIKAADYPIRVK